MKLSKEQYEHIKTTLKNRPSIVKQYTKPDYRSYIQVLNTLVPLLLSIIVLFFLFKNGLFLYGTPLIIINAFLIGRLMIIQHDCSHFSFF